MPSIVIRGAREHNLKNLDLELPRNSFNVITGLSGSGKSSLAFDTIYAEGQRRYVESLSAYARQFLGQMQKPDVDSIEGLSPAISIEQKTIHKNPRSTVGTITEIYDHLRLLYSRIGKPHCYKCGRPVSMQSTSSIIRQISRLKEGTRAVIIAPLVRGRKGEYKKIIEEVQKEGFNRIRLDGKIINLLEETEPRLDKKKKHTLEVVVDRLTIRSDIKKRLADSVETALKLGEGQLILSGSGEDRIFSRDMTCTHCQISYGEITPRLFSFNSPYGACPVCTGLGMRMQINPRLLIPDPSLSVNEGAVRFFGLKTGRYFHSMIETLAGHYHFSLDTPWKDLSGKITKVILYGSDKKIRFDYSSDRFSGEFYSVFEGLVVNMERRYRQTSSQMMRGEIEKYMSEIPCQACGGLRLKPEALSVTLNGKNIIEITRLSIARLEAFFKTLKLSRTDQKISGQVMKEIKGRTGFLMDVGLSYLTLGRMAGTLSGGEAQRIRLAAQIGSRLVGVTYILDEPSIGLHQKDNEKLLQSLIHLRDLGNTLIVIEHDEETMNTADYIVDMGPGAGEHGGRIVAQGDISDIKVCKESLTGQFLSGVQFISVPGERRSGNGKTLKVWGAKEHNLKNIDVEFPLGKFICITGVSGSGKSTLINDILFPEIARKVNRASTYGGLHDRITGTQNLDKVISIDQSPIGRTPRSNPATYTGCFTPIRELFARLPDARMRGYKPGRFSFNVPGGRCETCEGDGVLRIEMHFLPDVFIPCEECGGLRFNDETLEILYKKKNISEILNMSVEEALSFFNNIPVVQRKLQTLVDVGLGYIRLGQSATTFSGGEAQRIKLAAELSKRSTGKTLYLLDEPTTGLHFADIRQLIHVLNRFVDNGNTVIVIEHNLDVIKVADHVIDLGPEGGEKGGTIIARGTPEYICTSASSATGRFLKKLIRTRSIS